MYGLKWHTVLLKGIEKSELSEKMVRRVWLVRASNFIDVEAGVSLYYRKIYKDGRLDDVISIKREGITDVLRYKDKDKYYKITWRHKPTGDKKEPTETVIQRANSTAEAELLFRAAYYMMGEIEVVNVIETKIDEVLDLIEADTEDILKMVQRDDDEAEG